MKYISTYILTWFLFIPFPIINGLFRERVLRLWVTELAAHQLSTLILIVMFVGLIYWLLRKKLINLSTKTLLTIGLIWVILTVSFEFIFGLLISKVELNKLLADYNLFSGRLWLLFLFALLITPLLVKKLAKNN